MASEEQLSFNEPHPPHPNAIEAFHHAQHTIKANLVKNRHYWDKHEPRMWSRAADLTDHQLTDFHLERDLVLVSSSPTTYGTILLGKLRIPAINDELGEGFIHVRLHDPPNRGDEDVMFHSIWHDVSKPNADGHPTVWKAIQTADEPLAFFNE